MDDPITQTPTQTPVLETPATTAPTPTTEPAAPADPTLLQEPGAPAPASPAEPAPTILTEPVSPVKADGTFIEGWKDRLPDEIKNEECLNLVTDFPEMVKQFVNQRKAIGKNKIAVPTDKSDENEWNLFYEAIGRPKTETGYTNPEIPEELQDIFTEDKLIRARERAYALGATQKQYAEYLKGEMEEVVQTLQNQDEFEAKANREARLNAEKELRAELGAAYDERMHAAQRIITEAIPKESDRLTFIEKYGNDSTIIRLLSTIGARMSEHSTMIAELTQKTPTELQSQIKTLENDPRFRSINSDMTKEERQQRTEELRGLYKKLYPAKKTG